MKIYLVGGAVRDELLNLSPKEKDWVVVGATVDEMLKLGYRQVGKDFPVFLHPKTNEEYALARVERKIGRGYAGFSFDTSTHVTLEEDLKRRDLTINAMAKTDQGELIDPYHGKEDLDKKLLRHVSQAFVEDPVRILRIARFAARYAYLGFDVAPETNELMKMMVASKEIDALVPERVWKEFERALTEKNPEVFFQVLADCHALAILFPQISAQGVQINALIRAAFDSSSVRFAALLHNLPVTEVKKFCDTYRVPNEYRELALLVSQFIESYKIASQLSAKDTLDLLMAVDVFRREGRFDKFLLACEAVFPGDSSICLRQSYLAAKAVNAKVFLNQGLSGKEIADKIYEYRLAAISDLQH